MRHALPASHIFHHYSRCVCATLITVLLRTSLRTMLGKAQSLWRTSKLFSKPLT